ncbi:hypothetical protein HK101_001754 [Irineochytrium annulatum]|nr:hypothetical protein HK101_001754 [Irineochytrium annulatum]
MRNPGRPVIQSPAAPVWVPVAPANRPTAARAPTKGNRKPSSPRTSTQPKPTVTAPAPTRSAKSRAAPVATTTRPPGTPKPASRSPAVVVVAPRKRLTETKTSVKPATVVVAPRRVIRGGGAIVVDDGDDADDERARGAGLRTPNRRAVAAKLMVPVTVLKNGGKVAAREMLEIAESLPRGGPDETLVKRAEENAEMLSVVEKPPGEDEGGGEVNGTGGGTRERLEEGPADLVKLDEGGAEIETVASANGDEPPVVEKAVDAKGPVGNDDNGVVEHGASVHDSEGEASHTLDNGGAEIFAPEPTDIVIENVCDADSRAGFGAAKAGIEEGATDDIKEASQNAADSADGDEDLAHAKSATETTPATRVTEDRVDDHEEDRVGRSDTAVFGTASDGVDVGIAQGDDVEDAFGADHENSVSNALKGGAVLTVADVGNEGGAAHEEHSAEGTREIEAEDAEEVTHDGVECVTDAAEVAAQTEVGLSVEDGVSSDIAVETRNGNANANVIADSREDPAQDRPVALTTPHSLPDEPFFYTHPLHTHLHPSLDSPSSPATFSDTASVFSVDSDTTTTSATSAVTLNGRRFPLRRRRRRHIDLRDLTGLAELATARLNDLRALAPALRTSRGPGGATLRRAYLVAAGEIVVLGKGIATAWTPVARACEDRRLRETLLASLASCESAAGAMRVIVRRAGREADASGGDAAVDGEGVLLACAVGVVRCAQQCVRDLEAARVRLEGYEEVVGKVEVEEEGEEGAGAGMLMVAGKGEREAGSGMEDVVRAAMEAGEKVAARRSMIED